MRLFYKNICYFNCFFPKLEIFYQKIIYLMLIILSLKKNNKISNKEYANQAIKRGFIQLISRILLQEDNKKTH